MWKILAELIVRGDSMLREIRRLQQAIAELKAMVALNIEISKRIEEQVTPIKASGIAVEIGPPRDKT